MEDTVHNQSRVAPAMSQDMMAFACSNLNLRQYRFWMQQRANPDLPIERFLRVLQIPPRLAMHLETVWFWFSQAADATRARLVLEADVPRLNFESAAEPLYRATVTETLDPAAAVFGWVEQTRWNCFGPGDLLHRHALITLANGQALWAFTANHLVSDGRSGNVTFRIMIDGMKALARGESLPPLELPSFEANMAEDRARDLERQSGPVVSEWDDWQAERSAPYSLFGIQDPSPDVRRPIGQTTLSPALLDQCAALCQRPDYFHRSFEVTLSNVITALAAVWAWRHGAPAEQVVGVPFHGRTAAEQDLIGFKSETLPVRIHIDPAQRFAGLLQAVHGEVRESLKRRGQSVANPLHAPVFRMFVGNSWQPKPPQEPDSDIAWLQVEKLSGTPEFVNLSCVNTDSSEGGMNIVFRVRTEIANKTEPAWLAEGFRQALVTLLERPDSKVGDIRFEDADSSAALAHMETVRQPAVAVDWLGRWVAQLRELGERDAVIHGEHTLSHAALAEAAGRWHTRLVQAGLQPGDRVVVWAHTSNTLSAFWIGLMSAGGVYVPVHHSTPQERVRELVISTGAAWVVHAPEFSTSLLGDVARCIALTDEQIERLPAAALTEPDPDSPAHIFHTSGSTGVAKGILVSHRALAASIHGWIDAHRMQAGERLFHFYAITFDPWLTGLIPALWLGGTCVTWSRPQPPMGEELINVLVKRRITTLYTPTAYFHALCDLQVPETVRRWVVGGEALAADKAVRFLRRQRDGANDHDTPTALVNAYGPTETTIWAGIVRVTPAHERSVPIGRPIATCGFRIVDASGDSVPFAVPGELWITGPQLADGYAGQPELTGQQFVIRDGKRWYRTGDVVALRKDGELDFFGRSDRQVQIRGYRVEPGEIEQVLRTQPGIVDAVVVPVNSAATTALCAYVIPQDSAAPPDATSLRIALLRDLPEYKVPRWVIGVPSFPTNANGKVNVSVLPAPQTNGATVVTDYLPTLTLWDLRFAFEEVLDLPRIGVDEDFFDLGGDSLLLIELIAAIKKRCGKTLEPVDVVRNPTIGGLAPLLETGRQAPGNLVVELRQGGAAPLFCIPGAGGIGVEFYALSRRLESGVAVVVLRSSGTDGYSPPPMTVEALLDEHVSQVLDWCAEHAVPGPVHLMGYSLGGIFAFELAKRLRLLGKEIGRVFLIDAHVATAAGRALSQQSGLSLRERLRRFVRGTPEEAERLQLMAELANNIREGRMMDPARLGRLNLLGQARLARDLHSTPADLDVTYFLASTGPRHLHAELWKSLVPGITIERIEGDHGGDQSIVREPNVQALAVIVQERLNAFP